MTENKNNLIVGVLVVLLVLSAFAIGTLWTKVQSMDSTTTPTNGAPTVANPTQPAPTDPTKAVDINIEVADDDFIRGNPDARIVMVEYSDLECPYCKSFHPMAKEVFDANNGQVAWIYRHFPLTSIHPVAQKAAEAAECVGKLGGNDSFWAFVDAVYDNMPGVTEDDLATIAQTVGVDSNAVASCISSDEMANNVQQDITSGNAAGTRGTPNTIVIDTQTGETYVVSGANKPALEQIVKNILNS